MTEPNLPQFECLRCGHKWIPRGKVTICPKCKSPYWNKSKEQKQ